MGVRAYLPQSACDLDDGVIIDVGGTGLENAGPKPRELGDQSRLYTEADMP